MINGWLRLSLQIVPIATEAPILSSGATILTFAASFALPVDGSILDITFRIVADQIVVQKLQIVVMLEEAYQCATNFCGVRVNHLGKMTDHEAMVIRLEVIQISLLG